MLRWIPTVVLFSWCVAASAAAQDDACAAGRAEADRLYRAGEFHRAATAYVELARREEPYCPSRDALLYNAALAYDGARLVGRALQVRGVLLRNFPESRTVPLALWDQAAGYHMLAMYDLSASFYLRFAEQFPGEIGAECTAEERDTSRCRDARIALENATFFYLGLGDREAAAGAVAVFLRSYRETAPELAATMAFSLAPPTSADEAIADPAALVVWASAFLADFGAVARMSERARALVLLARGHLAAGNTDAARRALDQVLEVVAPDVLAALSWNDRGQALQRVRARDARAEALFLRAELQPFESTAPPPIRGARTAAGLRAWAEGPLASWVAAQRTAIDALVPELARAGAEEIPAWELAAQERIGSHYLAALEAARAVPVPAWVERDDALWLVLDEAREAALAELRTGALEHHGLCSRLARLTRWFSVRADRCDAALTALDRRHEPPVDELFGDTLRQDEMVAPPMAVTEVRPPETADEADDSATP